MAEVVDAFGGSCDGRPLSFEAGHTVLGPLFGKHPTRQDDRKMTTDLLLTGADVASSSVLRSARDAVSWVEQRGLDEARLLRSYALLSEALVWAAEQNRGNAVLLVAINYVRAYFQGFSLDLEQKPGLRAKHIEFLATFNYGSIVRQLGHDDLLIGFSARRCIRSCLVHIITVSSTTAASIIAHLVDGSLSIRGRDKAKDDGQVEVEEKTTNNCLELLRELLKLKRGDSHPERYDTVSNNTHNVSAPGIIELANLTARAVLPEVGQLLNLLPASTLERAPSEATILLRLCLAIDVAKHFIKASSQELHSTTSHGSHALQSVICAITSADSEPLMQLLQGSNIEVEIKVINLSLLLLKGTAEQEEDLLSPAVGLAIRILALRSDDLVSTLLSGDIPTVPSSSANHFLNVYDAGSKMLKALRRKALLAVKVSTAVTRLTDPASYRRRRDDIVSIIGAWQSAKSLQAQTMASQLTSLFAEQDDELIDFMYDSLRAVQLSISPQTPQLPADVQELVRVISNSDISDVNGFHPHIHFLLFLKSIDHDHLVLLDLLTSNETCFLEYFTRYLRFLVAYWPKCRQIHAILPSVSIDALLATLVRLSLTLERLQRKHLLPYDPTPLLRGIDALERTIAIDNASGDDVSI